MIEKTTTRYFNEIRAKSNGEWSEWSQGCGGHKTMLEAIECSEKARKQAMGDPRFEQVLGLIRSLGEKITQIQTRVVKIQMTTEEVEAPSDVPVPK